MDKAAFIEQRDALAQKLSETEAQPVRQIGRVLNILGAERTQALVQQSLQIEANGGMSTRDGSRKRTLGGIFFELVRNSTTPKERGSIFGPQWQKQKAQTTDAPGPTSPAVTKPFVWNERLTELAAIGSDTGGARSVKVTLIGRPGKVVVKDTFVMASMPNMKRPDLPKGLPTPPESSTNYLVFIAKKQWAKIAEAAKDPEDTLIIEGFASYDPQIKGLAVFAQSATSKKVQQAQRETQKPSQQAT